MPLNYDLILTAGNSDLHRFFVVLAAICGGWLIAKDSRAWLTVGLNGEKSLSKIQRIFIVLVVSYGASIGAAIPAFLTEGVVGEQISHFFKQSPEDAPWVLAYLLGPKTVLGGLLFGFLGIAAFKKLFKVHYDTSDAFARGGCLMMAVGRLGCIAQHCCFGRETTLPIGVNLGDSVPRFPIQTIEAIFLFSLFGVISYLYKKSILKGRLLFFLFAIYGIGRFGLEFLREQIASVFLGLGYYQWIALVVTSIGIYQFLKRSKFSSVRKRPFLRSTAGR